ncbi:unnamed protein product [Callosobruchus maculatus]|uniref:Major facilitator superfamily (MFS) profile domain-containing protein n=1 Tax=Callosobruchus maculatus TaxID=64391 RepID=A0A653D0B2_CALMS|nr:unnamed protein product [Callosobruchus maculatus]
MSNRCDQTYRERMGGAGTTAPVYAAAVAVCVGAVCTGIALAFTSNASEKLIAGQLNGLKMRQLDMYWNLCMMTMGACVSTLPVAMMLDSYGRKATMMVSTLPFYLGYILIVFAQHIYMVHVGRFITGLGAGAFSCCCPLYAGEIAPKVIRGRVISFYFMFVSFGFVYATIFGWLLPIKLFIFACMIVPLIFTAMFFFQPKSPVHAVQTGKAIDAAEALRALRGPKYDVTTEINTIKLELSRAGQSDTFFGIFKDRGVVRATVIAVALQALKHLVGATLVLTFSSEIVRGCEFSNTMVKWSVIIGGLIQALASLIPLKYVDTIGRRFLLIIGFTITFTTSIILGVYKIYKNRQLAPNNLLVALNWLPLSALAIYWLGYGAGLGTIASLTAEEVFPADVRVKCKCFTEFCNWFVQYTGFASFVVTMAYLQFGELCGHEFLYCYYCFFSIIGILLTIFIYPEGTNKTSLEIFTEIKDRAHIYRSYKEEPIFRSNTR